MKKLFGRKEDLIEQADELRRATVDIQGDLLQRNICGDLDDTIKKLAKLHDKIVDLIQEL